jgi:hypothetical protein
MPLNSNGTYSYVKDPKLSDRRNAILKAVSEVVPSVSGDKLEAVPKGMQPKFNRLSRMDFVTIYYQQYKIANYTTCNTLIGYAAEAAGGKGAPPGKRWPVDKIVGGPLQLQDPKYTGKAWRKRQWDRHDDPIATSMLRERWANAQIDKGLGSVGFDPGPPESLLMREPEDGWDVSNLANYWWRQKKIGAAEMLFFFSPDAEREAYIREKLLEVRLPKPGDFYALNVPGEGISHVGVVFEATEDRWVTADAGQYVMASRSIPADMADYEAWLTNKDPKKGAYPSAKMKDANVKAQAAKFTEHAYNPATGMFLSSSDYEKGSRTRPVTGWVDVDQLDLTGTVWST